MKKLIVTTILLLFVALNCYGFFGVHVAGTPKVTDAATYSYIGYLDDDTDGIADQTPTSTYSITTDRTDVYMWAATEGGTVRRVRGYFKAGVNWGDMTAVTAVYYENLQLRGTASWTGLTNSSSGWIWSDTFSSYSGRSLTFITTDDLRFGGSVDCNGETWGWSRYASGANAYLYETDYVVDGPTWGSGSYDAAFILEYE